jgi:hypothetical protein
MYVMPQGGKDPIVAPNRDKIKTATSRVWKLPPPPSKNTFQDIKNFLVHRAEIDTLIKFPTLEEQESYSRRIMQRLGIQVSQYSVLNLHRIGIDAPVQHVFNELLDWNGDSTCWPNYIARVYRDEGRLETIRILLFGVKKYPFGIFSPLFYLNAIRIQKNPSSSDYDNARYLLYRCSGGYPIGIFSMYVRSSIPEEGEKGQCQLFSGVGFDFYGKKNNSMFKPINKLWEAIHNRVTANTLNRFKQLCEWRFEKMQQGED